MYCQSCGTSNTKDSRYCKRCGRPIAAPGEPGGPIPDVTAAGVGRPRAPAAAQSDGDEAPPSATPILAPGDHLVGGGATDTVKDPGPPSVLEADEVVAVRPALSADGEPTVRGQPRRPAGPTDEPPKNEPAAVPGTASSTRGPLAAPRGHLASDSMSTSLSVRLSDIGARSPRRLLLGMALAGSLLFALGAGAMYLYARGRTGEPATVATDVPGDSPSIVIGMPMAEPRSADPQVVEGALSAGSSAIVAHASGAARGEPGATEGGPSYGASSTPPSPGASSSPERGAGPSGAPSTAATSGSPSTPRPATEPASPAAPSSAGSPAPPPSPPPGEVEERDPAVGAYASQVRYVISRFYSARAQSCFERASREHAEPVYGTVVVRFVVGSDGNVRSATPVRNTTTSRELGDCLAGQVRSWRLPEPPAGEATMEMPFSQ